MIIDFHTHVFPDSIAEKALNVLKKDSQLTPQFDGTLNGLKNLMEKADIDLSVVLPVATKMEQVESINNYSIKMNKTETKVLYFGAMHPDYLNYKVELERLKENGIKGIKIHPEFQTTFIDDIKYINIIEYAFKIGLIVVTHSGYDPGFPLTHYASVERINSLLKRIKSQGTLVLAHLGGFIEWDEALKYEPNPNLYFDTAITLYDKAYKSAKVKPIEEELFLKFIEKFGSDKILFGSDNPWMNPSYILDSINKLNLDIETKENILYKNACKLLGREYVI